MLKPRILLIDDSEDIHLIVKRTLEDTYDVTSVYSAQDARQIFDSKTFEIVIIDLVLGQSNGMDLLRDFKLRDKGNARFFIMTGKDSSIDEAQGHTIGVDEYLKKPVNKDVLKAIVKKNLKILREDSPDVIDEPPFYILPQNFQVYIMLNGVREEIQLTIKEFKLLIKFVGHPDKTYSREDLFAQVWENDSNSTFRTIDMHVSSLRKKLKDHGSLIKTVHQVGYKYSKSLA